MPELERVPGLTLFPGDATESGFSLRAVLEEGREEEGYCITGKSIR
jgi:hypothetical protein